MSKRLEILEKLTSSGQADSFAWYALALEYRSAHRVDDALRAFETLRERYPDYVPGYQMAGAMLAAEGREEEAAMWLQQGIERATAVGNEHARAEMRDMLALMGR
jgi:tetratricopeptide (TPR) repeat protein